MTQDPQLPLIPMAKVNHLGQSEIAYKSAHSILTPTSGFLESYDYSLNPYSGCAFGCTYCYAAFFTWEKEKQDNWGYWVEVKENALALLQKKRKRPLINKNIYMSSVTDPYQPIEKKLELTRGLLHEFHRYHQVNLVIQTRSPLVVRDIDILRQMASVQVNMTVTTDSERVRRIFEPACPSNSQRLDAITRIKAAGIGACITMTPLLPVENAAQFAQMIADTAVEKAVVQYFHATKGQFVAGTRDRALDLIKELNWTPQKYKKVVNTMRLKLPHIMEGKPGFKAIS